VRGRVRKRAPHVEAPASDLKLRGFSTRRFPKGVSQTAHANVSLALIGALFEVCPDVRLKLQ
jgi:hypothetical protein